MSDMDFRRMQEEAARRAREMHSRARTPQNRQRRSQGAAQGMQGTQSSQQNSNEQQNTPAASGASPPQNSVHNAPQSPQNEAPREAQAQNAPQMPFIPSLSGVNEEIGETTPLPESALENLFKDRERTVLLALLILLGADGGNNELMFALLFLLME